MEVSMAAFAPSTLAAVESLEKKEEKKWYPGGDQP